LFSLADALGELGCSLLRLDVQLGAQGFDTGLVLA
jgi:hypothetical protein